MKLKKSRFLSFFLLLKEKIFAKNTEIFAASLAFAFVLSFSLIGLSRFEHNGQSLMANVANIGNSPTSQIYYSADVVLQDQGDKYALILGKDMQKVDFIEGILAFDSTQGMKLNSPYLKAITEGVYAFRVDFSGENIKKGTSIAIFEKNIEMKLPIMLSETQFTSEGERYNITNTVE